MTPLLALLMRVTFRQWVVGAAISLGVALYAYAAHWHTAAVREGKNFTRDSMLTAAARVSPAQRESVFVTALRTDTLLRRVVQRVATVETVTIHVPDSVRVRFPVVDSVVRACTALANDCAQIRATLTTERAARESLTVSTNIILTGVRDSLHIVEAIPKRTWQSTSKAVGVGALVGAAITFFVRR